MSKSNYNLIKFVKELDNNCQQNDHKLDGNEIKEFYKEVISSSDPLNEKIKSDLNQRNESFRNVTKRSDNKTKVIANDSSLKLESIFKICQNGELEECRKWLRMGFDVNIRDRYSWTPLMCSSCGGHEDIVRLLLQNKANVEAEEKTGRTAFDLAFINGHNNICQLISDYRNSKTRKSVKTKVNSNPKHRERVDSKSKSCDVCQYEYKGSDVRHNCSIVHQITLKNDRKFNKYFHISESNKGFQMLLRNGWTRDSGLGPDGSGRTAPIKTVLKKDRLGLGNSRDKPRVTHDLEDGNSLSLKQTKSSKCFQRNGSEKRLKRIEIKFRRDFK